MSRDTQSRTLDRPQPQASTPVFSLSSVNQSVTRDDGTVQDILDGVTLDVHSGEFLCILGPSGCGKTTLLHLCAGFDPPTSGTITFLGAPVNGPSPQRVVVFQDASAALFGWRTIVGNIEYALALRSRTHGRSATRRNATSNRSKALDLLALVGLERDATKYPHQLSGGGRQRAQLARALASDPEVLLMDEPLGALDALTKRTLQREILRIAQETGKTILYITHDVNEAALMADRVIVLSPGPRSQISLIRSNDLPKPRTMGDPAVAHFVEELETVILAD